MNKMADSSDEDLVPELPANADQILFVKDLFDYMELQYPSDYDIEWDPTPFRENIYNAFNPTVKNALSFLDNVFETVHEDMFLQMQDANSVTSYTYERFAENLAKIYFPDGLDSTCLLRYCVILCKMAKSFYSHGVLDASVIAKKYMLKCLQGYDMLRGGECTGLEIVEKY